MTNPLVSVVITTYNQGRYIEETLASVMAQSFTDYEVIVVDDGSTDDTPQRLASFKDKIKIIRQPNAGVAGSRNSGVTAACGQYIAFLDGDDLWHEDKLTFQVNAALAYPESGLIAVDGVQFKDEKTILSHTLFGGIGELRGSFVTANFYNRQLQSNFISTMSQVMIPVAVLREIGSSDPRIKLASDYDLYIRISKHYPFTLVKRPLVSWRYLPTSASGSLDLRTIRYHPEDIQVLKKSRRDADTNARKIINKTIKEKYHRVARQLYDYGRRDGNRGYAILALLNLLRQNPGSVWVSLYLIGLFSPDLLAKYCGGSLRMIRDMVRRGLKFGLPT
jgi:glycosyltransferase involved in cell wall biosynthesis